MAAEKSVKVRILGDDSDLSKKLNDSIASLSKWSVASVAAAANAANAMVKASLETQDALAKLGLSLNDVQNLSDIERISLLISKIKEITPAAQQASVMADLFGSSAALAMSNLPTDDISRATDEINRYKAALSDIQATQIEEVGNTTQQDELPIAESPAVVKAKEETQAIISELQNRYKTEQELLDEKYIYETEALIAALESKLITQQEYDELTLANAEDYQEKLKKIEDAATAKAKKERDEKIAIAKDMFGNLSSLMNTESRKMFEIGKVAAVGEATMKGAQAVLNSYEAGTKIGGPPLGAAFAATAAVATAVQIQKIASSTYGGGGKGGASSGMSAASSSSIYEPSQLAQPDRQVANISITGDMFGRNQVIGLIEEMNDLFADGVRLNIK